MPIYEVKGRRANVQDGSIEKFLNKYPDAKLVEQATKQRDIAQSTPRQSNIQNQTDAQVEENTVQQPNNGIVGGFTTFKDGTSGFIPAMKMPEIKIEQPKLGLSKSQITKGTPFENKTLLDSTQETVRNMPVSPEAHFDSEQSVYKQNQNWIKEVQNDPSISPEVKQALLDDYNKNIRISNNTIEDKDLPLYAKQWLKDNEVDIPTTVYVQGSSMFGGGSYVNGTKKGNTPEQIAFIKDFIANTPQGQNRVNKQKAYVEYLENSISDVETRVPELKKKYWQEQYDLSRSHPYPMGRTNGKAETDAARKDYIEKSNAITERMSALDLAEKNAEDQKKLLAAVRDGDLNVLSQFGKQIGRNFWEMAGDIGTLGIRPMMQSLYESSDVKGLQERMNKGELTEEDRLAMSAMANNQAYQELMGDRRTIAQEVASGITDSMSFMVNFALTGGVGKAVTGGAKELLKQGIKRNAVNAIKQGAKIGTEKLGARLAGFGLNVADATGRASVMAAISPHTYRDMFDNMTGQVTYGYDEEGKPYYLGNVEQMDVANALFSALRSNTIENVSEFSGFGMEKGQVALSRLLKQRVPEVAKALSFGSTRNQFFQGVNKAMQTAGFNGTINEFLEEQVATILHSFFEDGQAQWSDLVDPRQQFITYLTVAAIGSGSAIMNTGGNQLMKHGAKKAYNNAFQDFGTEFYNSQNNDIAGQFADAVRNGTIEEKQSALSDIVNSDLFNDKQKLAALNLYRAGLTYESYEGTKEAQVEEATKEIPALIEENANPEMNAIVHATIAGIESPVQIIGGNIVPNEDGTINRDRSDKQIYYIDVDGNRKVTSIKFIENITENISTQDAIDQVTEQVATPIITQQQNEEVRTYDVGEEVRVQMGNMSLVGVIDGVDENGNYLFKDTMTQQELVIEPREIVNEDNLIGIEPGMEVQYFDANGAIQTGVMNDLYSQRMQGGVFIGNNLVPVSSIIGVKEESVLAPPPGDMMIGENGAVPYNPNITVANEQNIESIIANAPKQKNGKIDYNALMDTDPNTFAQIWESRSGSKATQAQLQRVSDNIASQITSQQNKLSKETDFNKIADIEDAISELQNRKEGIDSVINNRYVQHPEIETPVSEIETNLLQTENRENEHLWDIAENSDNPIDIASAYNEAMQTAGEERLNEWQKQLLGRKINRASFERFGDRNLINGTIARSWFNRKGEESNSGSIDIVAQELGTDVQSIVDFITDHPSNRIRKSNDLTESLNDRFRNLAQEITGLKVGGIDSNSGKLFLSTLDYAANNTPSEIETEFIQSDVISNIPSAVEFFLNDYMKLDEVSDFNEFRNTVEEADNQGYFMFPLEPKDKETILNYINNAERQAKAIQGIDENVSSSSVIEDGKEIVSLDTENTTNNGQGEQISERVSQSTRRKSSETDSRDGIHQSISQRTNRSQDEVNSEVERRTSNNRGRETSTSDIRQVARGRGGKQQQLEALESYAKENSIWIDDTSILGEQFSQGGENEVLYTPNTNTVFKLNNFEYAGDDVINLLNRLDAHNLLFPEVSYTLNGFAKNSKDQVSAVLEQRYVKANQERKATTKEIAEYMQDLGFEQIDEDTYSNKDYEVFDAFSNNVLLGADGLLYPIDTQIRSNAQENTERFAITETEDGKYHVIDTETNQQKSRTYDNRKSAEKQQQALYEALSKANKSITELEAYSYFSKESQDKAERALSVLDSFDPSNITIQDANKIIDIISNKPVPFFQVQQALETKSIMIGNQDYYTPDYLKKYILYSTKDIPTSGSIAEKITQAEAETDTNPTDAQKEAGNYKKGKVSIQGFDLTIEQPKGSERSGTDENGNAWSVTMQNTYGYIRGTEGKDGDHIDIFLGNNPDSQVVYVVDQVNDNGEFDEHKVMFGFNSMAEARDAYLSNYSQGWQGMSEITGVDIESFRKWTESDSRKIKPFAEYAEIKKQSSTNRFVPIKEDKFNDLVDRLKQTGLAKDVITDKESFDKKLSEVIDNDAVAKQMLSEMESIKQESIANNTFMLAPNGEKTNLSESQWLQTRTTNFKNWFGDWVNDPTNTSKVVDKNGEPLVVYHGTSADFDVFDKGTLGKNFEQSTLRYGYDTKAGNESINAIKALRDKLAKGEDEQKLTARVYRAVPNSVTEDSLINRDWITLSKEYANDHGLSRFGEGEYKIIEQDVPLNKIWWDGNDINEFGYDTTENTRFLRTSQGEIYGFVTPEGEVYLDSTRMNANTPIHEFGHLWNSFTKKNNAELYNRGAELVKESEYWQRVNDNPSYRDLSDEAKMDEALAMAIGDKGEAIVNRNLKQRFVDWVKDVWNSIREAFGFKTDVAIEDMTLSDFTDRAVQNLLNGEKLSSKYSSVNNLQMQVDDAISKIERLLSTEEDTSSRKHEILFGVPENIANEVAKLTGINVADYSFSIDKSEINHVLRRHTNQKIEESRGQIPIKQEDFRFLPSLLISPDHIESLGKDKLNRETLEFTKKTKEGNVITYHAILTGRKEIAFQTMFKKKPSEFMPNDPTPTPETTSRLEDKDNESFGNKEDNIRFQSVNDVADANNSRMTEEMRIDLDMRLKNKFFKIREAWEDKHLAVKEFLDVLRENGADIEEHNDYYLQVTHMSGKNDAQLDHYRNTLQRPLNSAISDLQKVGFEYRDVENYVLLKDGLERNEWMRNDAIRNYQAEYPNAKADQLARFIEKLPEDYAGVLAIEEEIKKTAEEFIQEFEDKAGKQLIDNLWDKTKKATRYSLQRKLEGGLISKKDYDHYTSRYEHYVPQRGHDDVVAEDRWDYTPAMGTYFVNPIMKANGRRSRAEKPFAYIAQQAQSSINEANRNILNQTLLRLANQDKTGLMNVSRSWYELVGEQDGQPLWEQRQAEYSENPETYQKNIEKFDEHMTKLQESGFAFQSGKKLDIGGLFIKKKQAEQHEVHIYQNGVDYTVYINANPKVAQAMNGTNVSETPKVVKPIAKISRFMAANFTTRNPMFVMTNFSRDYLFASSILPVKENAKYALQFHKNIPSAAGALQRYLRGKADMTQKQDQYLMEYILGGAKIGFSHIVEIQKMQKQLEKDIKKGDKRNALEKTLEVFSAANDFAENLSRLSVYITSREQGRSQVRSVSDAKEVTVNFNRSGSGALGANVIRPMYLFVNAGLQSIGNFAKVAVKNPSKTAAMMSSYVMTGALLAPMLAQLLGGDDGRDEYMKLGEWERQNNFCIYTGKGFIKIPLPHELRVFHRLGDQIYHGVVGAKDWTEAFIDGILGFSDLVPIDPIEAIGASKNAYQKGNLGDALLTTGAFLSPDFAKPFTQLAANKNFMASRIYNEYAKADAPGYKKARTNRKGDYYAPAFLVKMAEGLDNITGGDGVESGWASLNPDIVEHFARGYFGGLYNLGMQSVDVASKVGEFTKTGELKLKVRDTPLKTFFASSDDLRLTSSATDSKYYSLVKKVESAKSKVGQYEDQIDEYMDKVKSGDMSATEFAKKQTEINAKIDKLDEDKALDVYSIIQEINDWQKDFKELNEEEQKEAERIISELKEEAVGMWE